MKKAITFLLFLFYYSLTVYAQNPPPADMPTKENEVLIDKIIQVTDYEKFFKTYCLKKVEKAKIDSSWSPEYTNKIKASIQFKYFQSTIYNVLASSSAEELSETISLYIKLNQNRKFDKLVIINGMILNNLELFANSMIKGKYIMP